ncbi:MAG: hypothetical protein VBE63_16590 [Lamprobacter sp.]|uniref:hypothetical protein n=1 Tax=Lamprobacter sp. TaxID=3100796 RepID=UPI002B2598B7|nr:hypothetical protein [Lamprobacter sp.]MEA3641541.1 hypothetical protein [Lamprobacter sp.]
MQLITHLADAAFQSLLISSIETFPSSFLPGRGQAASKPLRQEGESFGLLFGQRLVKPDALVFNVALAVPMLTARRNQEMVRFSGRHFFRIQEVTESFPFLGLLGTFHSHPCHKDDYDARSISGFSEEDAECAIEVARDYGDELLEVILGITALGRHSRRPAQVNGETIHSYCGRFKYALSAYCTLGAVPDEEEAPDDDEEDDDGALLAPVDRLICPLAAYGGDIFGRTVMMG